jgi:hypothetical protein
VLRTDVLKREGGDTKFTGEIRLALTLESQNQAELLTVSKYLIDVQRLGQAAVAGIPCVGHAMLPSEGFLGPFLVLLLLRYVLKSHSPKRGAIGVLGGYLKSVARQGAPHRFSKNELFRLRGS